MHVAEVTWARRLAKNGTARLIREGAGLSTVELARELGVSPGAVSLWERGRRVPRGDVAERYAQVLRQLIGGGGDASESREPIGHVDRRT
jgi:transcriptional regulator with XRE-family HTH domain